MIPYASLGYIILLSASQDTLSSRLVFFTPNNNDVHSEIYANDSGMCTRGNK